MARGRHLFAALTGGVLGTTALLVLCFLSFSPAVRAQTSSTSAATLIIRSDDAGMSHSVNMALQRLIQTGLPLSISVMFPTPWYQEIVGILKQHPEVSVGIHLTLNSEWRNYRWGPIVGREAVPTLVDSDGYFFPSSEALHDHHPDLGQVEKELRAQIDRALKSGLKIDYVDYHMGTAVEFPEFREIVERLAHEYSLGMMGYFGDQRDDRSTGPPRRARETAWWRSSIACSRE